MPPPMRNGLMCSASHLGPPLRAPGQTVVSLVYQQMQETGSLSYPPSIRKSRTINQEIRCPLALRTLQPISDINLGQISALITVKWYTGNRNVLKLQFPFLIGISFYSVLSPLLFIRFFIQPLNQGSRTRAVIIQFGHNPHKRGYHIQRRTQSTLFTLVNRAFGQEMCIRDRYCMYRIGGRP